MNFLEIVLACLGGLVTIIFTVYVPKFVNEVHQLRLKLETLMVQYESRLTKVETTQSLMIKLQQRRSDR